MPGEILTAAPLARRAPHTRPRTHAPCGVRAQVGPRTPLPDVVTVLTPKEEEFITDKADKLGGKEGLEA